jgi:transposase
MTSSNQLLFDLPGFEVDEVSQQGQAIELVAHSTGNEAICPACQQHSQSIHSYYERSPADLPFMDRRVHLRLTVKRFRCQNPECSKATFVERWPHLLPVHAQRTERLRTALGAVAYALGGNAGSDVAEQLKMPSSGDTLLRILRQLPKPSPAEPEILGVDDWAKRRGRWYGTILIDLERRQVLDLLPNRTAETLAEWLRVHPLIKIVTRDRSAEYARGIALGAPQAQQVADRWHLLVNLRDAFTRILDRVRPELMAFLNSSETEKSGEILFLQRRRSSPSEEILRDHRRARRLELHKKVHRLRRAGHPIQTIAHLLSLSRMTVYRYLAMSRYPERVARHRIPSILDPFLPHLQRRWQEGCRNASQLWREIQTQGFPGTRRQVTRWAHERRQQPAASTPRKFLISPSASLLNQLLSIQSADQPTLPAARRLVWLFLKHSDQLDPQDLQLRDQLLSHPTLLRACQLAQDFQRLVRERQPQALETWLASCESAAIPELANFAAGLRQDYAAVHAALSLPWSNGQTEGQVNRLKLIKRQMYGRAHLDLLRLRVLAPP